MPTQTSVSELEYVSKKKVTRRDRFLAEIEAVTPRAQLVALIEPHYPKGSRGRPPIGPWTDSISSRRGIRAKGEHAFHVVKNLFHHRKTRYRDLTKNTHHLHTPFGLANLVLARRWLLTPEGQSAS